MTEEMDNALRKSLDEVDRTRKRQWVYLALSFVLLSLFLISITKIAENVGDARLVAAVWAGALVLAFTNILTILGLSLFINRMTNKILKAIELVSKNRAL